MEIIKAPKKLAKYHIKKKAENDMEFEETSPFVYSDAEKILNNNEQINFFSKTTSFFIIILIGILGLQTFKLQIIDKSKFTNLAENNRLKEVTFRADRGIIYDKNNNILVRNKAFFDLVMTPREIPRDKEKLRQTIADIAKITSRDFAEIESNVAKSDLESYRSELILENLNISQAIAFETVKDKMLGFEVKNNAAREYLDAEYFSHIIGYMGRVNQNDLDFDNSYETSDFIGKEGLESFYEKYLRGEKGRETEEIDAAGRIVSVFNKSETKTGGNLILTLDGDLQKHLQDSLGAMLKKIPSKENNKGAAAAVAMDPRNGKILAMVSLPAYDNNIFADSARKNEVISIFRDQRSPLLDRAISGVYPPGSTIKLVMGAVALSEDVINKNTIIEDNGVISIPNPYNPGLPSNYYGWNRSGLGPMNIISALAQSSDIFFYTVGGGNGNFKGLGIDKISEYFKKFNLGAKLGIDLPGEAEGFVPTKAWKLAKFGEDWNLGNTYHISIGQGYLLVTPLQAASWTAFMANGGKIFRPYLVDKVVSGEDGMTLEEFNPQIIKENIIDPKYINNIRQGMREVVLSGSGRALKNLKVAVAGKTGTAEFGTAGNTHAWFTAFAPYDNPEIVLTILIESGGEGGINAVPVAKDVLEWYFNEKR